jgi:hypothetical protein
MKSIVVAFLVCALCLPPAVTWAQAQSWPGAPPPPGYTGPEFRDPKTGQIWTPYNVGQDGKPVAPADRAFDPSGQAVVVGPPVSVVPTVSVIGKVPISTGPVVTLIEVNGLSLQTSGDGYWHAGFHLQNTSPSPRAPEVVCTFKNGDKPVMQANVAVPSVGPGDRISVSFNGPRDSVFVDGMDCRIASN